MTMQDEHDPTDETYSEAKQRARLSVAEVWHAAVNLGPEWVEEHLPEPFCNNPWRHWIGKSLALFFIGLFVIVNWAIGAMVFGHWDAP